MVTLATAFYVWIADEISRAVVSSTVGGRGVIAPGDGEAISTGIVGTF